MKLSLCDKCNCITKTIVTANAPICGKCKEIKTSGETEMKDTQGLFGLLDPRVPYPHFLRVLGNYTRNVIAHRDKKIVKMIEGMKKEHDLSVDTTKNTNGIIITNCLCGAYEYNQALQDLLTNLKQSI